MKRTFRVAIILIPVAVLLVGIGLWRHHYLKIMNAEPVKVYKVTLVKGDDNRCNRCNGYRTQYNDTTY